MPTLRYLVHDVDAALPFYTALGFTLTDRWGPPFAVLQREDLTLWLSGPGTSAQKPLADGSIPTPGGYNRLVLTTPNIAATLAALPPSALKNPPIPGPAGQQALLQDPSGNLVELFQPNPK